MAASSLPGPIGAPSPSSSAAGESPRPFGAPSPAGDGKALRPSWVEDGKECINCQKPFTLGRRRHHCRACGNLICDECSFYKPLPDLGYAPTKKERVCEACLVKRHEITDTLQNDHRETRRRLDSLSQSHSQQLMQLAQTEAELSRTMDTHAKEKEQLASEIDQHSEARRRQDEVIAERDESLARTAAEAKRAQEVHAETTEQLAQEHKVQLDEAAARHAAEAAARARAQTEAAEEAEAKRRTDEELASTKEELGSLATERSQLAEQVEALQSSVADHEFKLALTEAESAEREKKIEALETSHEFKLQELSASHDEALRGAQKEHDEAIRAAQERAADAVAAVQTQLGEKEAAMATLDAALRADADAQAKLHRQQCEAIEQAATQAGAAAAAALRRDHARKAEKLQKTHQAAVQAMEEKQQEQRGDGAERTRELESELERVNARLAEEQHLRALADESVRASQTTLLELQSMVQGRSARADSQEQATVFDDQVADVVASVADLRKLLERSEERIEESQRQSMANLSGSATESPFAGKCSPVSAALDVTDDAKQGDAASSPPAEMASLRAALRQRDEEIERLTKAVDNLQLQGAAAGGGNNSMGAGDRPASYGSIGQIDDLRSQADRQSGDARDPGLRQPLLPNGPHDKDDGQSEDKCSCVIS